jgi:hypothetical protein
MTSISAIREDTVCCVGMHPNIICHLSLYSDFSTPSCGTRIGVAFGSLRSIYPLIYRVSPHPAVKHASAISTTTDWPTVFLLFSGRISRLMVVSVAIRFALASLCGLLIVRVRSKPSSGLDDSTTSTK